MRQFRGLLIAGMFCFAVVVDGCTTASATGPPVYSVPPENAITLFGHACCYIDLNGVGIVTDPVFEDSYSLFHNRRIPAPPDSAFALTRVILISHAHRDHLSWKTIGRFPQDATVLCPQPATNELSELDMTFKVMMPHDSVTFPGGVIIAVPAYHPGGRNSLKASADGRALGFIIRTPELTLYYSGDTEYFDGMRLIGRMYHPQVAVLNINSHLNSTDVVRAVHALGVAKVIPSHFGAYGPKPGREQRWRSEIKELLGSICVLIPIGQSVMLPPVREGTETNITNQGYHAADSQATPAAGNTPSSDH